MTATLPLRAVHGLRRAASGLVGAVVLALAPAGAAGAQSGGSCPTDGLISPVTVSVTSPASGAAVTGPRVTVRGTATALVGELSRVEVTFGDETVGRSYPFSSSIDFDVVVDAAGVPAGQTMVRVRACGSAASGVEQFSVAYQPRAAVTSTTASQPTTTAGPSPGVTNPAPTTTVAAAPAAGVGQPTTTVPSATTVASSTTTVAAPPAPAGNANRPEPVRPGTNADGSVVLSDSPDEGSSRPPLWVGAVVGLSGGLGLLFSATTWRRRHQPQPLEPVEPELVDVG